MPDLAPVPIPSMKEWILAITSYAEKNNVQVPYAAKWMDMESGGNPCAVGRPDAHGPDGNPREMGVAQFYNPDDLTRFGLTGTELRAYCVPGDQHEMVYKGKTIKGFSQNMIRPMTKTEMEKQANATVDLIRTSKKEALSDLLRINATSSAWSSMRRDFWRLVKLQHGLPGLSRSGLPAVAQYLKRAPIDWDEFKKAIMTGLPKLDTKTERYRSEFPAIFTNAETCASVFQEQGVV